VRRQKSIMPSALTALPTISVLVGQSDGTMDKDGFRHGAAKRGHGVRTAAGADVVVIHETDGRKYLQALLVMADHGELSRVTFHSASVVRRLLHALVRERMSLGVALSLTLANFLFRLRMPFLRDRIIVLAVAPWDYRLLLHSILLRNNRVIYNTSWPWWDGARVPRHYKIFGGLLRASWRKVLASPKVTLTAVTPSAASAVAAFLPGRLPRVIPHAVSEEFFTLRACYAEPFKLLFVGELTEKKGFREFANIASRFDRDMSFEIVGHGPLSHLAAAIAGRDNCRWHGHISSRKKLAAIAAECQAFLSPARKTQDWEELFGLAIVESMALGLPCIVTNHIGPRGLIQHGINGVLIEESDPYAALSWIFALKSQPDLWNQISRAAVETARHFSLSSVVQRWREALSLDPVFTGVLRVNARHAAELPSLPTSGC
jgi:glycosyltransferase involved in cell wall biosynthesis